MKGTPKQIEWARDIQREFKEYNKQFGDVAIAVCDIAILKFDDAVFWIKLKTRCTFDIRDTISWLPGTHISWNEFIEENKDKILEEFYRKKRTFEKRVTRYDIGMLVLLGLKEEFENAVEDVFTEKELETKKAEIMKCLKISLGAFYKKEEKEEARARFAEIKKDIESKGFDIFDVFPGLRGILF